MQAQLEQRLRELKAEFEAGQKMLAELETKQANVQQTLLRISGAIQVLEELLSAAPPPPTNGVAPPAILVPAGDGLVTAGNRHPPRPEGTGLLNNAP